MPDMPIIVIAEDDVFLQRLYKQKFSEAGFQVEAAGDGELALKLVTELVPQALVLDVDLPKLNGLDVLEKVRQLPATAKLPVVVLTNSSQPGVLERARSLGASEYLIKAHFLPSEVVAKVKALLG